MRFSARSKGGILLSIITILTLVSAIMVTIVSRGTASHAASTAPITATYQGKPLNGVQTATLPGIPTKVTQPHQQQTSPQDLDARAGGKAASKTGAVHGVPATTGNAVDDAAVRDSHDFAVYQFDLSLGGTCFGDQPHVGYDNNNQYVATDEFCGPTQSVYEGALLIAISKSQLLQEVAAPNAVEFGPLALGGVPILTLQPAVGPGIGTEYLLNSFPFDQFGNNNSIANTLGFWRVKGGIHVTTGGTVTLTGTIITSETYAFPQPAASTGNGSVTLVSGGPLKNIPVTSEAFLNPDDDRMQ